VRQRRGRGVSVGLVLLVVIGLALLAGCTGDESAGEPRIEAPTTSAAGIRPSVAGTTDLPRAPDPERPAVLLDITKPSPSLPNPFVLVDGARYLLYTTEALDGAGAKKNVPVLESQDLRTWTFVHDALDGFDVGAWAVPEATWAPDVAHVGDRWVLYYTARVADRDPDTQCIGVAAGSAPQGPFVPAPDPIVCQLDRGGSIDPRSFRDRDGTWWLHWKSDDNRDVDGTTTTSIYAQRLDATGTQLVGEAHEILEPTQEWEGRIVEAPQMIEVAGRLWLFYSANWFNQPAYGMGVAECQTPAGPCTKPFDGPWLSSNAQGEGPGEGSLFLDRHGRWRLVYSPVAQEFRDETDRPIAMATVGFDAAGPYLADPNLPDASG
jgi:beta-xylosidase